MERFQHSSETISRYFFKAIQTLISLAAKIIRSEDPSFVNTPGQIVTDPRYMSYFKNCIGAIDDTHADIRIIRIPSQDKVAYIGRHGSTTQNVMAICDFNMCFTYVMTGRKESTHDSQIFSYATKNISQGFPHSPSGKYYLVDAGYPMQRGYLKTYPDTKYHILDFERASDIIRGKKEIYINMTSRISVTYRVIFCYCGLPAPFLTSRQSYNFGRQFYGYRKGVSARCGFFRWQSWKSVVFPG
ncbi:uncharacterized protein LOC110023629 [Phalaenopsis equestris]|uniref:uncharacterized protein LOC110023629 n=1 Tax=Phalaenopsis equestris TaxID=78828 RepID=UPI0009E4E50D|nr:uncharacterized protein LOC110023629 [Phalaenopsis equestris]